MTPFRKPGAGPDYAVLGAQAARLALADARAGYESVQQAFVSYVHGDSTAGQRVLYDIGMTGIPIVNVRNGGASGSTALFLARQAIASGEAEIVLALGFEQAPGGAAGAAVMARTTAAPIANGAAAAVLCSEDFARRHGLDARVWIAAQAMASDAAPAADAPAAGDRAGFDRSRAAARRVYRQSGVAPRDIDVVELHDGQAPHERQACDALELCADGGGAVVNPSGGLLARGHAAGATGLAQCFELVQQLRGRAERRQVPGARIALQHNVATGGAAVVTMYRN